MLEGARYQHPNAAHHSTTCGSGAVAAHNDSDAFVDVIRACAMVAASAGQDRGRKPVQHGWRPRPIEHLMVLADRQEAFMLIDEAHANGVYRWNGRGLAAAFVELDNFVRLPTCGKALATGAS
ncbi:hypothetical protein [Mesorhizobium sp. M0500]|uniref:hypothetical protein n=1 Tax=Mesorhizobium sp. M0500 TaxID=2956953 RepID=UPI00333749F6